MSSDLGGCTSFHVPESFFCFFLSVASPGMHAQRHSQTLCLKAAHYKSLLVGQDYLHHVCVRTSFRLSFTHTVVIHTHVVSSTVSPPPPSIGIQKPATTHPLSYTIRYQPRAYMFQKAHYLFLHTFSFLQALSHHICVRQSATGLHKTGKAVLGAICGLPCSFAATQNTTSVESGLPHAL